MKDKQYILRQGGRYFVKGSGFTASSKTNASALSECEVSCVSKLLGSFEQFDATLSYAVVYIRRGEGVKLLDGGRKGTADASKGQVDPSKRRFATEDEAWQHGTRARERKANRGDRAGSAGHEGFFVIPTTDPVNSAVNWKSGLTNSL